METRRWEKRKVEDWKAIEDKETSHDFMTKTAEKVEVMEVTCLITSIASEDSPEME